MIYGVVIFFAGILIFIIGHKWKVKPKNRLKKLFSEKEEIIEKIRILESSIHKNENYYVVPKGRLRKRLWFFIDNHRSYFRPLLLYRKFFVEDLDIHKELRKQKYELELNQKESEIISNPKHDSKESKPDSLPFLTRLTQLVGIITAIVGLFKQLKS